MRYLLFIALMISGSFSWATNVVVTGNVSNDLARVIKLEVNQRYLDNTVVLHESEIVDGKFIFEVILHDPQIVRLKYAQNIAEIYLEPNSNLHIDFNANTFKHGMRFSGACGNNNRFLHNFQKNFPEERNQFNMVQFKKGIVSYKVPRDMEQKMLTMTQQTFRREQETIVLKKESSLKFFEENTSVCTDRFREFIWAEIHYEKAYNMLTYGHAFGGRHGVKNEFFLFMNEVPLQNENALASKKYQKYILAALNFKYMTGGNLSNTYQGQYALAEEHFSVRPLSFVRSTLIFQAIKKDELDAIIPVYQKFLETNPYIGFDEKLIDAYNEASRYAVGMPVPDFSLTDLNGNTVKLEDYKGKVVYLNFWATWCRPCMQKLSRLQTLNEELNNSDVVFLHVSFDRKEESWKGTIRNNNFSGTHVFAPGDINSEIAKAYNIKAIPDYYVISKKGRFAARPMTSDMLELRGLLERLAAQP